MVAPNEQLQHKGTPSGLQWTRAGRAFSTYSGGVIQPNPRIYFLQDANWDTTAVVGYNSTAGTWGVTQRYVYSPYGTITVLNTDWSTPPTGTQPSVSNLYQGMTLDSVTGLYDERFRNYSPELGTWISQDPAGYINGADTYQYVQSNPAGNVDPSGESFWGWVGTGAAVGGLIALQFVPGVDIVVDASGAIAVSGIGATAGGIGAGTVIGGTAGALAYHASIRNPSEGRPGSTSSTQTKCGKPKQDRRYGPDGFPETDVDHGHGHERGAGGKPVGSPHAHDWTPDPNGNFPHRGPGRPVQPGDPKS